MEALREIVDQHDRVAFLIGNGPNLASNIMPSWKDLLKSISDKPIPFSVDGLSNTEVYDLVELNSDNPNEVKKKVGNKLELLWEHDTSLHRSLMNFANSVSAPVLTTNFDEVFEKSFGAKLYRIGSKGFTRYYPWRSYYGIARLASPLDGFGIWKIHGDVRYTDSIRLGLTDYMGSVERARRMIHKGEDRLFRGKRRKQWKGHQSWLHIWFNLPIVIFGFGFGTDEVFLRWLLIERRRYLRIYNAPMEVYYLSVGQPQPSIANLLQNLGVEIRVLTSYEELYS